MNYYEDFARKETDRHALSSNEKNERYEDEQDVAFEEDLSSDDSFEEGDDANKIHFGNCKNLNQLDDKLQLFVGKMQKINSQLQQAQNSLIKES